MATETSVAGEAQASDEYQTMPRPVRRLHPETRMTATCMMWAVIIGMGVLICMMVWWALPEVFRYAGRILG